MILISLAAAASPELRLRLLQVHEEQHRTSALQGSLQKAQVEKEVVDKKYRELKVKYMEKQEKVQQVRLGYGLGLEYMEKLEKVTAG